MWWLVPESRPDEIDRRTFLTALSCGIVPGLLSSSTQGILAPKFLVEAKRERVILSARLFGVRQGAAYDNTVALSAALAAATAHGSAKIVFEPGTYRFSHLDAFVQDLIVEGNGATLISTLPVGTAIPAVWLRGAKLNISDLTIDFNDPLDVRTPGMVQSRHPNAYGLRLGGVRDPARFVAQQVVVRHVSVKNARGGGIQISYASNVLVANCHVEQALGNGIGFDNCTRNVRATANVVRWCGDDLLIVVTDSSVPLGTKDVLLSKNVVSNGFAKGIASSGTDGIVVSKNSVSFTFGPGIALFSDAFYKLGLTKNAVVVGNVVAKAGHFFGAGLFKEKPATTADGVYVGNGASNIRIISNTILQPFHHGIVATSVDQIDITGNKVIKAGALAILVGDPSVRIRRRIGQFTIKGNVIVGGQGGIVAGSAKVGVIAKNEVKGLLSTGKAVRTDQIDKLFRN